MSGGDGKDSRGPTGGVKGGPTGLGGGGNNGSHNDPYIRDSNGTAVGIKPGYHAEPSKEKPGSDGSHGNHINITGGVNAVPDDPSPNDKGNGGKGNGGNGPNGGNGFNGISGHPNVADAGQLGGDNSDKHDYHVRDGESVYSVLVDKDGNISFVSKIKSPPKNEHDTRLSGNDDAGKQYARNQVQAYLNEKKQTEEKAAVEAKAKADADAEAKRQAEEEAKRQQAEWDAQHQEEAAQRQINEAQQRIDQAQQDKNNAQNSVNEKQAEVPKRQAELDEKRQQRANIGNQGFPGSQNIKDHLNREIGDREGALSQAQNAVNEATQQLNQAQQRLEQAQREKTEAENRLNTLRAERQVREAAEVKRKADEEAAAKAKADAEAKAKADAEAEKAKDEKEALTKASDIIADMGEKIGENLGDKYKAVAKEIADDIKNFQGKTLRSYEQAMASLKKILDNPGMKINKGDKDAIVNAWKSFKADDTAKKLANLSKAFTVAGVALKIETVREKSIEGYETGNWAPLMLEVESWVLGGMAASVALGIFSATLGTALLAAGVPVVTVGIMGIIVAGTVAALIDDKVVDFINNEVIRPAH